MDVEKTIEFLLHMQAEAAARKAEADTRLTRIEALTKSNAEDIKALAGKLGQLAQFGIETDERIDKLAISIDNLVSGIGEFMLRDVPPKTQ